MSGIIYQVIILQLSRFVTHLTDKISGTIQWLSGTSQKILKSWNLKETRKKKFRYQLKANKFTSQELWSNAQCIRLRQIVGYMLWMKQRC